MTFRTFTTSEELFDLLLERFSMTRPDNLNEAEVEDWKKRSLIPTQRHVLDVFTLWLEEHRLLEEDPHIAQRLPDFIRHVATPRLPTEGHALLQNIERLVSGPSFLLSSPCPCFVDSQQLPSIRPSLNLSALRRGSFPRSPSSRKTTRATSFASTPCSLQISCPCMSIISTRR